MIEGIFAGALAFLLTLAVISTNKPDREEIAMPLHTTYKVVYAKGTSVYDEKHYQVTGVLPINLGRTITELQRLGRRIVRVESE